MLWPDFKSLSLSPTPFRFARSQWQLERQKPPGCPGTMQCFMLVSLPKHLKCSPNTTTSKELDGGKMHVVHLHDVRVRHSLHPRTTRFFCDGAPPLLQVRYEKIQDLQGGSQLDTFGTIDE